MRKGDDDKICNFCLSQGYQLLICSRCRNARYCSKPCQKAHWKEGHKLECKPDKTKKDDAGSGNSSNQMLSLNSNKTINVNTPLSIMKELWDQVQKDSISLDEAHYRRQRVQDEVDRLKRELKNMSETRMKKKDKISLLQQKKSATSQQHKKIYEENGNNPSKILPKLVQKVHDNWKCLVEDLTNISCYSIILSPLSEEAIKCNMPEVKTLRLSLVPSSSSFSSSYTQVTLLLVNISSQYHGTNDDNDTTILLSIDLAGKITDSNSVQLTSHIDCIHLRLMYEKQQLEHPEYQQALTKTTPANLLNELLKCKCCHSKLLVEATDDTTRIEKVLPLPSGYWDEIADYLMCYEGVSI